MVSEFNKNLKIILAVSFAILMPDVNASGIDSLGIGGNISGSPGDTITLSILAENMSNIGALQLDLLYNSSIITANSVVGGSLISGASFASKINNAIGNVTIGFISVAGIFGTGSIADVIFSVKSIESTSLLNIITTDLADPENNPVDTWPNVANSSFYVCSYALEWLPPISLDRSFNTGSTVPIKFNVTSGGIFVSDDSVAVNVFDESGTEVFNATTEKGKGPLSVKINKGEGHYKVNMHTNKSWADGNYLIKVSFNGTCKFEKQLKIEKKGSIQHKEISNGSKVKVNFSNGINITFDNVTGDGDVTSVEYEENPGGTMPSNFKAVGAFYDITTTAGHIGDIYMCIPDDGVTSQSGLYHDDGAEWDDITTSVDGANHVICGTVSSLSPFGIFEEEGVTQEPSTGGGGGGGASPKIFMLANSIDLNLSTDFTEYLMSKGVRVEYLDTLNFTNYKKMRNIVILGGPDAPEGVDKIIREVLNKTEQSEVRTEGSRKFYIKNNLWASGQRVFIIAGNDRWDTMEASIDNMESLKAKLR